jgi:farnesyl diphosphate synthase
MARGGSELSQALERIAGEIDRAFHLLLEVPDDPRARLYEAMRHAAIGGGKRLRPLLVCAACDLFAVDRGAALRVATAIECMHVYSLVHDDLPAMDDDDMRRGKPTVHKAYDEAAAILAGDALHALAFELLADPFVRAELCLELARASGPDGMAGGQMMDLVAGGTDMDLAMVTRLQQLKTGALFSFCLEAGAIMGRVPPEGRTHLRGYARSVGLAFQIVDDLIDVEGDAETAGKAVRKDAAAGKATFVSHLGVERAREQARLLVDQAVEHLKDHGPEANLLRDLARYIVDRDH